MATITIITTAAVAVARVELGAPADDDVVVVVMLDGANDTKGTPDMDGFQ